MKSADQGEPRSSGWRGKYVNKNIYGRGGALLKPAHARLTGRDLEHIGSHGVLLTEDDFETAEEAATGLVEDVYAGLTSIFESVRKQGTVPLQPIERQVLPIVKLNMTSGRQLLSLLMTLQEKDNHTCQHSIAVAVIAAQIGRWLKLGEPQMHALTKAALLHDIGKLRIPERILRKPGSLSRPEYEEMKRHTVLGYDMLIASGVPDECALAALRHHERLDGSGYPYGLKGKQIDQISRIVSIADVFHAMSSRRVYKDKMPFHAIIREMERSAFGLFDARIVTEFTVRMMELTIGEEVTLSDGRQGVVVSVNPRDIRNPIVKVGGRFVNLSGMPDLNIVDI